jgi:predicted amidohydrolase YtcJ
MLLVLFASSTLAPFVMSQQSAPDLILLNGRVFTSDSAHPYVEALAIRGERIIATGTSDKIVAMAGPETKRIDVGRRVVIPGINDAHYHLGIVPRNVRLEFRGQDPTWQEVKGQLASAVAKAPKGTLILGDTGPSLFDDPQATRESLDKLAPNHPVALQGWTGHYDILNSAALRMIGVKDDEPDPVGGRFVRSADNGKLTGMALEFAAFRLARRMSELATEQEALQQTREFLNAAARLGITTVQNMSAPAAPDRLVALYEDAPTSIRIRIMRFLLTDPGGRITQEGRELPAKPSPLITVSGTKWILDGTPIERSCAMRNPYSDRPGESGWMDFSEKDMEAMLRESLANHDQLLAHIVGDRTTETFLNAMDATGGINVWSKRRVRIEHGDGLAPDLIPRAKALGVIVVQNPTHLALRELLARRWGLQRTDELQPLQSLLNAGIPLSFGSDGPFNPYLNIMLASIYPGKPHEALTREQAVIAYTLTSAYSEFAERDKGSLEPGKLADLAVLSQDIFHVAADALPKTESVLTMVGGKVIYARKE